MTIFNLERGRRVSALETLAEIVFFSVLVFSALCEPAACAATPAPPPAMPVSVLARAGEKAGSSLAFTELSLPLRAPTLSLFGCTERFSPLETDCLVLLMVVDTAPVPPTLKRPIMQEAWGFARFARSRLLNRGFLVRLDMLEVGSFAM